ncbi:MAG: bacterioferritin [Candidatus Hadarchaeaceae archaeon]
MSKEKVLEMLNKGLELEHAARIQYLSHAELIDGLNAEPIIARLKEIASDEEKHEAKFRTLIGDYLGGTPSMGMAKTYPAKTIKEILETNLKHEREAVDFYKQILEEANKNKDNLPYEFLTIEHEVRHILIDEQEHIAELKILLGLR